MTYMSLRERLHRIVKEGQLLPHTYRRGRWSPAEDLVLIDLYFAGASPSVVEATLHRSPESIRGRRRRLGAAANLQW